MNPSFEQSPHLQYVQSPHRLRNAGPTPPDCLSITVTAGQRLNGFTSGNRLNDTISYDYSTDTEWPTNPAALEIISIADEIFQDQRIYLGRQIGGSGVANQGLDNIKLGGFCDDGATSVFHKQTITIAATVASGTYEWKIIATYNKRLGKCVLLIHERDGFEQYRWRIEGSNEETEIGDIDDHISTIISTGLEPIGLIHNDGSWRQLVATLEIGATSAELDFTYKDDDDFTCHQTWTALLEDEYTLAEAEADAQALLDTIDISDKNALPSLKINSINSTQVKLGSQLFVSYMATFPERVEIWSPDYGGWDDFYEYQQAVAFPTWWDEDIATGGARAEWDVDQYYINRAALFRLFIGDNQWTPGWGSIVLGKCALSPNGGNVAFEFWGAEQCGDNSLEHSTFHAEIDRDGVGIVVLYPPDYAPTEAEDTDASLGNLFVCKKPFDTGAWFHYEPATDLVGVYGYDWGWGRFIMECREGSIDECVDTDDYSDTPKDY